MKTYKTFIQGKNVVNSESETGEWLKEPVLNFEKFTKKKKQIEIQVQDKPKEEK